ncbi:MAG: M28 family metallopeptidase [Candidatus Thorarchaeota archaeon SMTZ1-45]|nr:MAG: hypothetical protein AM325_09715 [Candidatus Thorarchaeota archaeon SMTZ1-45]
MKQDPLIFIICMILLVSPINGISLTVIDTHTDLHTLAPVGIERVYSTDYSHEVFELVSLTHFRNFIIKLTENGSRPAGIPSNLGGNNVAARNWIANELQSVSKGRIEVEVLGHYASVLGKLPGYLPVDAPALMVGGHYDSVEAAPGANDDGTGIATALELARVMSKYNWPLDIYFGAWNAEEDGLLGSREVAAILRDRGVELLAYYNVDMLLVPDPAAPPGGDVLMAFPIGDYHLGKYWADLTRVMSNNYGLHSIQPVASNDFSGWERSDHWPFVQRGYTALFAHESGFAYDTAYHSPSDVWYNPLYNYEIAIDTVKAIGGAMAFTMARAFGEPTTHDISFTLQEDQNRTYMFAISTPTIVNVTCRWFGGGTSISLYDTNNQLITQMVDDEASPWVQTQIISQSVVSEGIYRLFIANNGDRSVGHEMVLTYYSDIDGNDILDNEEFWFDQEYFTMDSDLDSISDGQEMILGTNHESNDSDSDTMPDSWEIENGLDPLDPSDAAGDNDEDGVINTMEYEYNCNPNNSDSDSDAMPDLWEIENGLNPVLDDSLDDPDNDAVTNIQEYLDGTDPQFAELRPERLVGPTLAFVSVAAIAIIAYHGVRKKIG